MNQRLFKQVHWSDYALTWNVFCGKNVLARLLFVYLTLNCLVLIYGQPPDCPEPHRQLLLDYKVFHNANKHSPDAQYIVQQCWGVGCEGVGDRIRGTLYLLRIAIQYRKILIVDWTNPAALTNFLLPNEIDWTLTGFEDGFFLEPNTMSLEDVNKTTYHHPDSEAYIQQFKATKVGGHVNLFWANACACGPQTPNPNPSCRVYPSDSPLRPLGQKFVITGVRQFEANATRLAPVAVGELKETGSCYYHFMFKLNQTIVDLGERQLQHLYGPSPGSYIAWHWRHYDLDFKDEQLVGFNHLLLQLKCMESLAKSVGMDLVQKPALLISDFNIFRQMVVRRQFRKITTLNITAKHIDKGKHSIDAYNNIFVDLYVMSRARCLMYSRSGFSKMALWMGGSSLISCSVDRVSCVKPIHYL